MVEDQKVDVRKNFMKRKCMDMYTNCCLIASYEDPMKKREEFAMSLRKKKTQDLISAKRRKLMQSGVGRGQETKASGSKDTLYNGYL